MKVTREELVELFEGLGYKSAGKWKKARLLRRAEELITMAEDSEIAVEDGTENEDQLNALIKRMIDFCEKGISLEIVQGKIEDSVDVDESHNQTTPEPVEEEDDKEVEEGVKKEDIPKRDIHGNMIDVNGEPLAEVEQGKEGGEEGIPVNESYNVPEDSEPLEVVDEVLVEKPAAELKEIIDEKDELRAKYEDFKNSLDCVLLVLLDMYAVFLKDDNRSTLEATKYALPAPMPAKVTEPLTLKSSSGKKVGVADTVIEFYKKATKENPITLGGIQKKLMERFPEKSSKSCRTSAYVYSPNRLLNDHGLHVHEDGKNRWTD
ncbi:MAG TPA: hypothetical protein ENI23_12590 [bacterium]|nr:hypothetical protein [bacterium]